MRITMIAGTTPSALVWNIEKAFRDGRFTISELRSGGKAGTEVILKKVRLRSAKEFCGQHPSACVIDKKHIRSRCLEGADWVEFNDRLNDLLDELKVSATVVSSSPDIIGGKVFIRIGGHRRIAYQSEYQGRFPVWSREDRETDFDSYIGKADLAPPAEFDQRTPGIYNYKGVEYFVEG